MTTPSTENPNVFVPQIARLYLAPTGTVAPDGPLVAMPDGWFEVGLFTPDSLNWATDPAFEEVMTHQSLYPVRKFQTADAATLECDLLEWTADNFKAVFGGGTVEEVTPVDPGTPYYKFTPPEIGGRDVVAGCIELGDGIKHVRRIIPVCQQDQGVTQSFNRTAASSLPLRLTVIGSDVGAPWYDMSDLSSFDPTVTP